MFSENVIRKSYSFFFELNRTLWFSLRNFHSFIHTQKKQSATAGIQFVYLFDKRRSLSCKHWANNDSNEHIYLIATIHASVLFSLTINDSHFTYFRLENSKYFISSCDFFRYLFFWFLLTSMLWHSIVVFSLFYIYTSTESWISHFMS